MIAALTLPSLAEETTQTPMAESEMAVSEEGIEEETELLDEPEEPEEEESDLEISGYLKAEGAVFTGDGTTYNPKAPHKAGDIMKGEGTLKVFVNGGLGEDSSFHAEIQAIGDTEGIDGYQYHRNYTQYDALRELYIDTAAGGWDFRLGKQQVVWGKADGVKFLDIINPTDFREWGQNTMEDSRIPLWMAVAEKDLGNNDSLQFVWVPDVGRINQIPGLYNTETGDQGQPFVSHGTNIMTGQTDGFVNIGEDMGAVSRFFQQTFSGLLPNWAHEHILAGFNNLTVEGFTSMDGPTVEGFLRSTQGMGSGYIDDSAGGASGNQMLGGAVFMTGSQTNLFGGTLDVDNPTTMFDYMGNTTFATFNAFKDMQTSYRVNDISRELEDHNFGIRYKKGTDFGLNFTLNYYRHWDNNPMVNMHWEGSDGTRLTVNDQNFYDAMGAPTTEGSAIFRTITLEGATNTDPATLVFEQGINQVNTYGASFDYALDTGFAPIVLRGEFVYDQGAKVPEVDLGKLSYGDIVGAMTMADADIFKYVIGADVTVATNLFISFQFMDSWNLDYVDEEVNYAGTNPAHSYSKFTANPATMSIGNGFKKAEEHQIMYTLFLSKPFLESDSMRVNNLFLYEQEDGGYWNRLDLEYSYADDILISAEWNQYGGDEYGVFGQFADMSNFQLGIKYIF